MKAPRKRKKAEPKIAVNKEGKVAALFNVEAISARKSTLKRLEDPEGGVYSIQKLAIIAIIAIKVEKRAAKMKCRLVISSKNEALKVPNIIAKKVNEVISPFALDILSVATSSGKIPYLEGPKIALSVAIRKRTK